MKRDLRDYSSQTDKRLIIGGILLLLIVGGGLIWWFYGTPAWALATTCMLGGLSVVVLIVVAFWVIDWILKSARRK
jgi:hypothetical protein